MSVKALARGLDVLTAVNELNPAAVKDVVEATGLPKATTIRLLKSLVEQGFLMEDSQGQGYRVTSDVRKLSRALSTQTHYSQIATPLLRDLSIAVKFPAIFTILDGASLLIEADSKRTAPLKLKLFERTRVPLLTSTGYAVLSALDTEERNRLIERALTLLVDDTQAPPRAEIDEQISKAQRLGYAEKSFVEGLDMSVISMAVMENNKPLGAVTLPYYSEVVNQTVVDGLLLPKLKETTLKISAALDSDIRIASVATNVQQQVVQQV